MRSQLVSVIVPVYNAQNTLARCVDSILSQTYPNLELLLINDHSNDESGKICDAYARNDSRVSVIHNEVNRGASASRNIGLDIARGEFIAFCDSDDVVSSMWISHLCEYADNKVFPMCSYCHDRAFLGRPNNLGVLSGKEYPISEYYTFSQSSLAGYLCNSLYCADIIRRHHLRLRVQREKGDYNEDLLFALQYVGHMHKLVYVGFSDYLYDTHVGSLSRSGYARYFEKYEEKYVLWRNFLETYGMQHQLPILSSEMLYHFLTVLKHETYNGFRRIVSSDAVQQCLSDADTSMESPAIIRYIKEKSTIKLWLRYKIHTLKGR